MGQEAVRVISGADRSWTVAHHAGPMPSEMTSSFVMTEHPSWVPAPAGRLRVVRAADGGLWLACVEGAELALQPVSEVGCEPTVDVFALRAELPAQAVELSTALQGLGPVLRLRNGDLWDALGTAILRQVIRASQSKRLYRAFCAAHGEGVELRSGGECFRLFPSWDRVLTLTDEDFASLGLAFKRRPLRAAARAFGEHGARWRELAADVLVHELQHVPGIGAWTAGVAVADWSNDWRLYPYSDLAVRTWARRAASRYPWPGDEVRFGELWRWLAGGNLSALTVLTLAWGSQHGDIG
jgi:DNA-3-methyladenine glycosylase II